MAKSADAFRTISEVADWLGVQAHVLRFWESKFTQIKPVKRGGGRRYYRPNDMLLIGGIKTLLYQEGMTIKGAQKYIRENGVKHVAGLSQPLDAEISDDVANLTVMAEPEHTTVPVPPDTTPVAPQITPENAAPQQPEQPEQPAEQSSELDPVQDQEPPKQKRPAQVKMDSIQLNLFADDDDEDDEFDPIAATSSPQVRPLGPLPEPTYASLMQYLTQTPPLSTAQRSRIAPVMADLEKIIDPLP